MTGRRWAPRPRVSPVARNGLHRSMAGPPRPRLLRKGGGNRGRPGRAGSRRQRETLHEEAREPAGSPSSPFHSPRTWPRRCSPSRPRLPGRRGHVRAHHHRRRRRLRPAAHVQPARRTERERDHLRAPARRGRALLPVDPVTGAIPADREPAHRRGSACPARSPSAPTSAPARSCCGSPPAIASRCSFQNLLAPPPTRRTRRPASPCRR